jgi:hypothetical protein
MARLENMNFIPAAAGGKRLVQGFDLGWKAGRALKSGRHSNDKLLMSGTA